MNRLIRWYNQNRRSIWIAVIIAVIAIGLVQVLNSYYKNNSKANVNSSTGNSTAIYNNPNYSVITGDNVTDTAGTDVTQIIDDFISSCNNGKPEDAYNLLSDSCKTLIYPTLQDFENNYYNKIFSSFKRYSLQAWITGSAGYTYMVNFKEDSLATRENDE